MESKFVSFMEAMKASKEGKVVSFYDVDRYYNSVFDYSFPINENGIELFSFQELIEGRWKIEE